MTTAQIGIADSGPRPLARTTARRDVADWFVGLVVIGALTCIGGAVASAASVALLIVALGAPWAAAKQIVALAVPFLAITASIAAIWLLGAIQTRRTLRRLAPLHDVEDRAAFAELNTLLARE